VPDVVTTTPSAAAAADVTSPDEDVLDVIDRLSQTTSDKETRQLSLFDVHDEIFPI